jgi:hypothetical protein
LLSLKARNMRSEDDYLKAIIGSRGVCYPQALNCSICPVNAVYHTECLSDPDYDTPEHDYMKFSKALTLYFERGGTKEDLMELLV